MIIFFLLNITLLSFYFQVDLMVLLLKHNGHFFQWLKLIGGNWFKFNMENNEKLVKCELRLPHKICYTNIRHNFNEIRVTQLAVWAFWIFNGPTTEFLNWLSYEFHQKISSIEFIRWTQFSRFILESYAKFNQFREFSIFPSIFYRNNPVQTNKHRSICWETKTHTIDYRICLKLNCASLIKLLYIQNQWMLAILRIKTFILLLFSWFHRIKFESGNMWI